MKKTTIFLLAMLVSASVFAQKPQEYSFGEFKRVSIKGIMQVEMTQGESNKVTIEGDEEATSKVSVEVKGSSLNIRTNALSQLNQKHYDYERERKKIIVKITFTTMQELEVGRGAYVDVSSVVKANHFDLVASSGGIVKIEVDTPALVADVTQGGIINISGKAAYQDSRVNTGGELHAYKLESQDLTIKANTGGVAQVNTSKSIEARAGTGGEINYKGNPRQRDVSTSLGGEVRQN